MEIFIYVLIILALFVLLRSILAQGGKRLRYKQNHPYAYTPKNSIMTNPEMDFFWMLHKVVDDRYFIFPQVHLSALLDHRIAGQEWKYAFHHINGKSVDYVLCSKVTLQPIYAVELDDASHDKIDRMARDVEVERIFNEANIPLVRFRDYKSLNPLDIANALAHARKLANELRL